MLQDMNGSQEKVNGALTDEILEPYNGWPNDGAFIGDKDYRTPIELTVTGTIPSYAAGVLYRNGPGGYKVDTEKGHTVAVSHWFDGFSQVHRFQITPGATSESPTTVLYNSHTTVDKMIESIRKTGSIDHFTFGQKRDPCQSLFSKVMSFFYSSPQPFRGEANIGVTISVNPPGYSPLPPPSEAHGSSIRTVFAKTDATVVQQLHPETLEPIGLAYQTGLHPELKGQLSAAHSKSDPATGEVFNFNLELGPRPTYRVFRVSASTGETDILARITGAPAAYIHSLFLTQRYVILCVWGSHYRWVGVNILYQKNILDSILPLDPAKPTKWYVIDRHHGKGVVAVYDSEPFFAFHAINAWDEPSASDSGQFDVVADVCAYENMDILKRFYYENMLSTSPEAREYVGAKGDSSRAIVARWRLPLVSSAAGDQAAASGAPRAARLEWSMPKTASCELPTINPKRVTRPHRYIYGVTDGRESTFYDGLLKVDTLTRQSAPWQQHAQTPSEAIFVPDPDGTAEDDGVLLSVIFDGLNGHSYLLCLDARNMTEIGRASLPGVVGHGFHGTHVPLREGKWPLDY